MFRGDLLAGIFSADAAVVIVLNVAFFLYLEHAAKRSWWRVTRGVPFVLKTLFFSKKIQKQEILPCKKLLFSLSVQNEEIPYKNSGFGNFFVRNSLFLEFLHQTNLRVTSHAKIERNTSVGACSHKRLFRSIFIPCVQRTHSTAVNEINVERPLRHIYELSAWLVT